MKDQEDRKKDKIKEMFKLHRHKTAERLAGNKVEFKLSSLQLIKVPKGWDKLFISIISVETGKLLAKSSKTAVQGETCVWTDSQSFIISQDDETKELEDSQIKIVVSTGSTRPGILGEVLLNLADYLGLGDSSSLLLPLENCESGTTLQVRIRHITPQSKSRLRISWKEAASRLVKSNNDDLDSKSDVSDEIFNRSMASSSSSQLGDTPYHEEHGNKDTSFASSGSHRSGGLGHGFVGGTVFMPKKSFNGVAHFGRQESAGSRASSNNGAGSLEELSRSNASSINSRASGSSMHANQWQENSSNELTSAITTDLSKKLLEATEEIEELHDEVKMWERHSRQLKLDIEKLRKETTDKSKSKTEQNMELSAIRIERDSLKHEVDKLKELMHESVKKQANSNSGRIKDILDVNKELEEEVKFQKECNANLSLQLKKTQESNIEFIATVQELEDIIEKQGVEIENILRNKYKNGHIETSPSSLQTTECSEKHSDLLQEIKILSLKVKELERDCTELTSENLGLLFNLNALRKDIKEGNIMHDSDSTEFQGCSHPYEEPCTALKQHMEFEECSSKENEVELLSCTIKDLETRSQMLEVELQRWKDEACDLRHKEQKTQLELEEKIIELFELKHKVGVIEEKSLDLSEIHERKYLKAENCKNDLELHILDLEQENLQLSERIAELEAQLRQLTNDKESYQMGLEDNKSLVLYLKEVTERQNTEIHMQKVQLEQKIQDAQHHPSEVREDLDVFMRSNSELQTTIVSLTEECNSLQNLVANLKGQKQELEERAALLEAELEHSRKKHHEFDRKINFLDANFSLIQEDIASKEISILSQLDNILEEQHEYGEKLTQVNVILNKLEPEKTVEVAKLGSEATQLTTELSSSHDEQNQMPPNIVHEASSLGSDKTKPESCLQEADKKVKLYENDMKALRQDSKNKIQEISDLLNISKLSEQMLRTDVEDMKKSLESVKSNEEKYRELVEELEIKLKSSDFEKLQIIEEASSTKIKLQKISHINDEIVVLKESLDEANSEKEQLVALLKSVTGECEELKRDRDSLMDTKLALQEKLLCSDSGMSAKEAGLTSNEQLMENERLLNNEHNEDEKAENKGNKELIEVSHTTEVDQESKVYQLESKHHKALEGNNENKRQLERSLMENQFDHTEDLKENESKDDNAGSNSGRILELEIELKDVKERYLQMSLQYAEVEAQRAELVLQLKSVKKDKRWFS